MNPAQLAFRHGRRASVLCDSLLRGARTAGWFFVFVVAIASAHAQSARTAPDLRMTRAQNALIAQRVATLRRVGDVLRATAASPLPRGLSAAELAEARRYVAWLRASAARLDALAAKGESAIGGVGGKAGSAAADVSGRKPLLTAVEQMQETQMSFNLQYLQLQSRMQNENRQFTAVSNIMKTKHDTVKNSISNIR
jgi:hypothetical protein